MVRKVKRQTHILTTRQTNKQKEQSEKHLLIKRRPHFEKRRKQNLLFKDVLKTIKRNILYFIFLCEKHIVEFFYKNKIGYTGDCVC